MTDKLPINKSDYIAPYDGNDMAGYIMAQGFKLPDDGDQIRSISNHRNEAIIVTDRKVYRARPCHQIGFCIECLVYI